MSSSIYDPSDIIRCHGLSKVRFSASDESTEVWDVAFEPSDNHNAKQQHRRKGGLNPTKKTTTSRVATCGGSSICVTDAATGVVKMRFFARATTEQFLTLAWTSIRVKGAVDKDKERRSILVAGGIRGEVKVFDVDNKVCFGNWTVAEIDKPAGPIFSLVFHSENPTWMFCATESGVISLWDLGTPVLPAYVGFNPVRLLTFNPGYNAISCLVWSGGDTRWLLAGTHGGLVGWNLHVPDEDIVREPSTINLVLPESEHDGGKAPFIDGLAMVSTDTVVTKCALHGLIYVWDLVSTALKDLHVGGGGGGTRDEDRKKRAVEVVMVARLSWSKTETPYINVGCFSGRGVVACGDTDGSIWLYHLQELRSLKGGEEGGRLVQPTSRMMWPSSPTVLENPEGVKVDSLRENIVRKVAVSGDDKFVVGVTSKNFVIIWKKKSPQAVVETLGYADIA